MQKNWTNKKTKSYTYPRKSWTFDDYTTSEIRRAAETGVYDIRGGGSKRKLPHFDDLLFLGASMSRYPLSPARVSLAFMSSCRCLISSAPSHSSSVANLTRSLEHLTTTPLMLKATCLCGVHANNQSWTNPSSNARPRITTPDVYHRTVSFPHQAVCAAAIARLSTFSM